MVNVSVIAGLFGAGRSLAGKRGFMKTDSETLTTEFEMRSEYDFSGAVRGKHYKPLHQGYSVHIHKSDGTTSIQHFKLEEGTVMLEPDVRAYFPDSKAVNHALRSLIQFMAGYDLNNQKS